MRRGANVVVECRTAESSNGGNDAEARDHVSRAPLLANRGRALFLVQISGGWLLSRSSTLSPLHWFFPLAPGR